VSALALATLDRLDNRPYNGRIHLQGTSELPEKPMRPLYECLSNPSTRYLPVSPESKRPLLKDWPEEASPHLGDVRRWLRRGYRLGMTLDGMVALDFDPAPGLFGLEAEFGALPATWQQSTPRAGLHRIYRRPSFEPASRARWRSYPEGGVDVKTGADAYVVLYGRGLPNLEGLAELPERVAQALPRGSGSNHGQPSAAAWAELAKGKGHYRMSAQTLVYLREDRERIAASAEGEQRRLLNGLGFKWGQRVKAGFLCPQQALLFLMQGAERMRAWREDEPWDMVEVQECLKAAILRGASGR
jgi:Bifunctional DNA primase/polymerase, N-terminal